MMLTRKENQDKQVAHHILSYTESFQYVLYQG